MAQRTRVELVDDLDGTEIADGKGETITYGLDNAVYEIDLSAKNAAAFRKMFEAYLDVSRKASSGTSGRGRGGARSKSADRDRGYEIADLRRWAAENNIEVPARGRIKAETVEAYLNSK